MEYTKEQLWRMKHYAPDLYEALKEIREYVIDLDAFGPGTGQVIAGKCYLALSKVETKNATIK